ncbi:MAG: DUF4434 domain-containing protein [Armatimonadetes bacterium]|nr:DUF4434 domain-containing protein [Armatimonadota bacterium]
MATGITLVPPGPVTDRVSLEVRIALANPGATPLPAQAAVYWDRVEAGRRVFHTKLTLAPGETRLVRAWCPTAGRAGEHHLLIRVRAGASLAERDAAVSVVASRTPALPRLQGVWLDPLGLSPSVYARRRAVTAADLEHLLGGLHGVGVSWLIVTYVEFQGAFFYPSEIHFFDRDMGRVTGEPWFTFDVVETLLAAADRLGMHVFLGLGRGGDMQLMESFDKPDWPTRRGTAVELSSRVARELWRRYGAHRSLYGWYLTHEMADLARASAYYDPVADACHALAPDKPVLCAPSGTPILDAAVLRASHVDIFAYQDAVGAGYVPGKYTYDPERRMAQLDECYRRYRAAHEGTGKHLWADLELWEMDGKSGYANAYPPPFDRVRRQIELECRYVEALTGYDVTGFFEPPGSDNPLVDARARTLFAAYGEYARARRPATR